MSAMTPTAFTQNENIQYRGGQLLQGVGIVGCTAAIIPVAITLFDMIRFVVTGNCNFTVFKRLHQIQDFSLILRIELGWALLFMGSLAAENCGKCLVMKANQSREARARSDGWVN